MLIISNFGMPKWVKKAVLFADNQMRQLKFIVYLHLTTFLTVMMYYNHYKFGKKNHFQIPS